MTPAQLTFLVDADKWFNDPEKKSSAAPQPRTMRMEDLLREQGLMTGE